MKKFYRLTLSVIGVLAFTLIGGATAFAQSDTTTRSDEVRTNQEERSAVRCERVQQSLESRTTRVTEAASTQTALYERIANVIAGADTQGYPTEALTAAQREVAQSITNFGLAVDTYTASLSESAEVSCAESTSAYSAAIAEARQNLQSVREAARDVRTTFREAVIPALQDFKTWLEENRQNAATTDQTTSEEE
tara:strand:- start:1016 stop:1597 length:582 start_codon:yes stop_codon:yes gene_type:complete